MNPDSKFLIELFSQLNRDRLNYCILRNYEKLPESIGNDVDIWVKSGEELKFQKIILKVAKKLEWKLIKYLPWIQNKGEGRYFFIKEEQQFIVLHIDCFTHINWKGISYVNENIFPKYISFYKKGFYIIAPPIEVSILLVKTLLFEGKIADKYKERIIKYSKKYPEIFIEAIRKPFSKHVAKIIYNLTKKEEWDIIEKKVNYFRWKLILHSALNRPFYQLKNCINYFYSRIKERTFLNHGFFIALIGPDGSGKTTIAKATMYSDMIKKLFPNKRYIYRNFGILPELKVYASLFKLNKYRTKNYIQTKAIRENGTPFSFFRSMIYPVYYGIEYFLGRFFVWKEKGKNKLIIFDRYFYEYLLQKQFEKCPRWFLLFISKIIAKPDALIFLKNNPKVIYSRKQELYIEEIERQSKICEEIVIRFPDGFIIETSCTPKEVVKKIQRIMLNKINKNIKF